MGRCNRREIFFQRAEQVPVDLGVKHAGRFAMHKNDGSGFLFPTDFRSTGLYFLQRYGEFAT